MASNRRQVVNFPKLDFNPEVFNNLISERGVTVRWEQATLCPCVRVDTTGRTVFSCGECVGGNLYYASADITAVITNVTGQRNAALYGEAAVGGIFVTTYGKHRLAINDRIHLVGSTTRYAELGQLASAKIRLPGSPGATTLATDHTRRFPDGGGTVVHYARIGTTVFSYTGKTKDTLTGIPASGPLSLSGTLTAGTGVSALTYVPRYTPLAVLDIRSDSTVYSQPSEVVVANGVVRFLNPATAPTGQFTFAYEAYPVYLVDTLSHEYRDQLLKLGYEVPVMERFPIAVVCRKDYLNMGVRP